MTQLEKATLRSRLLLGCGGGIPAGAGVTDAMAGYLGGTLPNPTYTGRV